jgi:hypothetical protein
MSFTYRIWEQAKGGYVFSIYITNDDGRVEGTMDMKVTYTELMNLEGRIAEVLKKRRPVPVPE